MLEKGNRRKMKRFSQRVGKSTKTMQIKCIQRFTMYRILQHLQYLLMSPLYSKSSVEQFVYLISEQHSVDLIVKTVQRGDISRKTRRKVIYQRPSLSDTLKITKDLLNNKKSNNQKTKKRTIYLFSEFNALKEV